MHEFERTHHLKVSEDVHKKIQQDFLAFCVDDKNTKLTIKKVFDETGEILDPHTAIGVFASEEFIASKNYQDEIVVTLATAHSAKFPDAVVSSNVEKPKLPLFLSDLLSRKEKFTVIENDLNSVKNFISQKV